LEIGWDVEAGGHGISNVLLSLSPALNEQYLLAGGNGTIGDEFRLDSCEPDFLQLVRRGK